MNNNIGKNSLYEDITISKRSKEPVFLSSLDKNTIGSFIIFVSDIAPGGAHSVFVCAKSSIDRKGMISRLVSVSATEGHSINAEWLANEEVKISHISLVSGDDSNCNYRVRILYTL